MNPSIIAVLVVFGLWILIYFGSRIQMKGWIDEIEHKFKDRFDKQFTKIREDDSKKEE